MTSSRSALQSLSTYPRANAGGEPRVGEARLEAPTRLDTGGDAGRLLGIDALRGVAALAVVLFHASFAFGYVGVYLFFVISGFCIHLRWARSSARNGIGRVEFWEFWKRRTIRLYPPYVGAVLLALALHWAQGTLPQPRFLTFDLAVHALMVHNLAEATKQSLNPVFWTLAVEEQLYLAYFLLLWLRGRFGWRRTLAVCLGARVGWLVIQRSAVALMAGVVTPGLWLPLEEGAAWHWFQWALGAVAVEAAVGLVPLPRWSYDLRVGALAVASAVALTHAESTAEAGSVIHLLALLAVHPAWGITFFVLVNAAARSEPGWRREGAPLIVRAMAGVGMISYSLYLTHALVLWELGDTLPALEDSPLLPVVVCPPALAFAWLFFRLLERPFITLARQVGAFRRETTLGAEVPSGA
jgi:peptidoglycan/LPS O-acetylase OafA/YrhL